MIDGGNADTNSKHRTRRVIDGRRSSVSPGRWRSRWLLVGLGLVFLAGIPALAETFDGVGGDVAGLAAGNNADSAGSSLPI